MKLINVVTTDDVSVRNSDEVNVVTTDNVSIRNSDEGHWTVSIKQGALSHKQGVHFC